MRAAIAVLLALACAGALACSQGKLTKVVRTDGTSVIGTLVELRPDAVVLNPGTGANVTIPRAEIASIETPSLAEATAHQRAAASGTQQADPRTQPPGGSAGSGDAESGAAGGGPGTGGGTPPEGTPGNASRRGGAPGGTTPPRGTGSTTAGDAGRAEGTGGAGDTGGARAADGAGASGTSGASGTGGASGPSAMGGTPEGHDVTVPAGTLLTLSLETPLASDTSGEEDEAIATLNLPVVVRSARVLPAGTRVRGLVTEATPAKDAGGRGRLAVRFQTLVVGPDQIAFDAPAVVFVAGPMNRQDAKKIGIGAAAGGLIGKIVTGTKKGLGIGAAAGAGATAAAVARQNDMRLGRGATVRVRLAQPVTLRVR